MKLGSGALNWLAQGYPANQQELQLDLWACITQTLGPMLLPYASGSHPWAPARQPHRSVTGLWCDLDQITAPL